MQPDSSSATSLAPGVGLFLKHSRKTSLGFRRSLAPAYNGAQEAPYGAEAAGWSRCHELGGRHVSPSYRRGSKAEATNHGPSMLGVPPAIRTMIPPTARPKHVKWHLIPSTPSVAHQSRHGQIFFLSVPFFSGKLLFAITRASCDRPSVLDRSVDHRQRTKPMQRRSPSQSLET